MTTHDLIKAVEAYADERGISPATVVSRAVKNGRLYHLLKEGHDCTLKTAARIREYMAANPVAPAPDAAEPPALPMADDNPSIETEAAHDQ